MINFSEKRTHLVGVQLTIRQMVDAFSCVRPCLAESVVWTEVFWCSEVAHIHTLLAKTLLFDRIHLKRRKDLFSLCYVIRLGIGFVLTGNGWNVIAEIEFSIRIWPMDDVFSYCSAPELHANFYVQTFVIYSLQIFGWFKKNSCTFLCTKTPCNFCEQMSPAGWSALSAFGRMLLLSQMSTYTQVQITCTCRWCFLIAILTKMCCLLFLLLRRWVFFPSSLYDLNNCLKCHANMADVRFLWYCIKCI